MDPTTTLTTVAGAIMIASKIITDLELLTNARSRTPRETSLVETELRTLHGTLQTVQAHFDPQRGDYMPIQLEQLHHVSVRAKTTLDALNAMIGTPRLPVLFRKARWTMNMAEVERHRLMLAGCTSQLNVLVATLCNQRGASIEALALKCYEMMENQVGTQSGLAGTSASPPPMRIPAPSVLTRSLERNFVPAAEANATSEVFLRKAPQTPTLATLTRTVDPDFAPVLGAQAIIQTNLWIESLSIPIVYVTNSIQKWGYLYLEKSKIAFIKDATLKKVKLAVQQDKDCSTQNYYLSKASAATVISEWRYPWQTATSHETFECVAFSHLTWDGAPGVYSNLHLLWPRTSIGLLGGCTLPLEIKKEFDLLLQHS